MFFHIPSVASFFCPSVGESLTPPNTHERYTYHLRVNKARKTLSKQSREYVRHLGLRAKLCVEWVTLEESVGKPRHENWAIKNTLEVCI